MAKRRKSYRAYPSGSVERQLTAQLRHAVSELRHGKKACKFAAGYMQEATDLLFHKGTAIRLSPRSATQQVKRYIRVKRAYDKKCGSRVFSPKI